MADAPRVVKYFHGRPVGKPQHVAGVMRLGPVE